MAARARADSTVAALAASAGDGGRGEGGEKGEGVSSGVGEKRQQGIGINYDIFFFDCGWCVVLLKRHSSIVRRPGRTCKHVRAPSTHPTVSEGVLGSCVITHAAPWGGTY